MDGAREQEGWLLRLRSQPSAHTNVDLPRPILSVTTSDCGRVYIRGLGVESYGWSRCCINISLGATTEIKAKCPYSLETDRDGIATRVVVLRAAALFPISSANLVVGITAATISAKLDPKVKLRRRIVLCTRDAT